MATTKNILKKGFDEDNNPLKLNYRETFDYIESIKIYYDKDNFPLKIKLYDDNMTFTEYKKYKKMCEMFELRT